MAGGQRGLKGAQPPPEGGPLTWYRIPQEVMSTSRTDLTQLRDACFTKRIQRASCIIPAQIYWIGVLQQLVCLANTSAASIPTSAYFQIMGPLLASWRQLKRFCTFKAFLRFQASMSHLDWRYTQRALPLRFLELYHIWYDLPRALPLKDDMATNITWSFLFFFQI